MKTRINEIVGSWRNVKNKCRTTVNKGYVDTGITKDFVKKILISEHSPIRLINVDWSWSNIPYWVSTEWSRHKFEKYISTQRTDRTGVPRDELPQGAEVRFDGFANVQNLIDSFRKRLCFQATHEARTLAMDFKQELHTVEPYIAEVLVPNCVYRGGCPEFTPCSFYSNFVNWAYENGCNFHDIQSRYDAYNSYIKLREWER